MSKLLFLTANLPTAKGPFDYIQEQGRYVLLAFMIYKGVKYYNDDKYGKMAAAAIVGGLMLFFIAFPDMLGTALQAIGNLFLPKN